MILELCLNTVKLKGSLNTSVINNEDKIFCYSYPFLSTPTPTRFGVLGPPRRLP